MASCKFILVCLDPGGAKKSGMKAERDHVPSRFSLRHLASIIIHCLQGKDGILINILGILSCHVKTLLPSITWCPHTSRLLLPQILFFLPPSLPSFIPYWRIKQSSQKVSFKWLTWWLELLRLIHHMKCLLSSWLHPDNVTSLQNTLQSHDLHPCKVGWGHESKRDAIT